MGDSSALARRIADAMSEVEDETGYAQTFDELAATAVAALAAAPVGEIAEALGMEQVGAWEMQVGHGGRTHPWSVGCRGAGCDPVFRFVRPVGDTDA